MVAAATWSHASSWFVTAAFPVFIVQVEGDDPGHHVPWRRDAKHAFTVRSGFRDDGIATRELHAP